MNSKYDMYAGMIQKARHTGLQWKEKLSEPKDLGIKSRSATY